MNARVSLDGTVAIPKEILDRLGLVAGAEVSITQNPDGSVRLEPVTPTPVDPRSLRERIASLRGSRPLGMSTDEYMALVRGKD